MMPLYQTGAFGYAEAMVVATLLGVAFGFVLERSGFGRADVLVAQFHGTDMRVLKVMFTAIATTAVGLGLLSGLGVVDLALVVIPETFFGAQIAGGLLLGVGFVLSGYCPGTAVVAAGSGYVDALYTLGGVLVGSLVFGFVYPLIEGLYTAGDLGVVTFPDLLGVPWALVALGVAAMAVGAFLLAERLERFYAARAKVDPPRDSRLVRNGTLGGLGAVAVAALVTLLLPDAHVTPPPSRAFASLDPVTLATRVADGGADLYLVDLRAPEDCAEATIPGAICLTAEDPEGRFIADLPPTRTLVLFGSAERSGPDAAIAGESDTPQSPNLPAAVARYKGAVQLLPGGYDAFRAAILEPPPAPTESTPEALSAHRLRAALHARFTGADAPPPPAAAPPPVRKAPPKKKGGGC